MKLLRRNFKGNGKNIAQRLIRLILLRIFDLVPIVELGSLKNIIPKKYRNLILHFQNSFVTVDGSDDCFIVNGNYGRKCKAPNARNTYVFTVKSDSDSVFAFDFAILESIRFYVLKRYRCDICVEAISVDSAGNDQDSLSVIYPIAEKRHAIGRNQLGSGWVRIKINLTDFKVYPSKIKIRFSYSETTFRAFKKERPPLKLLKASLPIAAISDGMWIKDECNLKKQLILIGESFTDPLMFFKSQDQLKEEMPNYSSLLETSTCYPNCTSMVDSTLPYIASLLTGKPPSVHLIGDYNERPEIHRMPPKIRKWTDRGSSIEECSSSENIMMIGMTAYGRLGFDYEWPSLFDWYFNAPLPFDPDAPSGASVIKQLEQFKHQSTTFFVHLTRLHLPFFSTDHAQNPVTLDLGSCQKALSENDFSKLYLEQYRSFDSELGVIIQYLKATNQFDRYELIVSGDHGVKMPPKWKSQLDNRYDLYEEHIRVPLLVKRPHQQVTKVVKYPTQSQAAIFDLINGESIQKSTDPDLGQYAISETIYHPNRTDLSISISTTKFKFWISYPEYLSLNCLSKIQKRYLLFEKKGGYFDEENDVSNLYPAEVNAFKRLANEHLISSKKERAGLNA